jgi:ribosome-associated protein
MTLRAPQPESLTWRFTRAGGSGGQHVNTSATRVDLACDIAAAGYSPAVTARLIGKLGSVHRVVVTDTRSQRKNREIAIERLRAQLTAAATVPRTRRPTAPKRGAIETRLSDKRKASERKTNRSWRPSDD